MRTVRCSGRLGGMMSARGGGGCLPGGVCPDTPPREQSHRRVQKHYPPATTVADGNRFITKTKII